MNNLESLHNEHFHFDIIVSHFNRHLLFGCAVCVYTPKMGDKAESINSMQIPDASTKGKRLHDGEPSGLTTPLQDEITRRD